MMRFVTHNGDVSAPSPLVGEGWGGGLAEF